MNIVLIADSNENSSMMLLSLTNSLQKFKFRINSFATQEALLRKIISACRKLKETFALDKQAFQTKICKYLKQENRL